MPFLILASVKSHKGIELHFGRRRFSDGHRREEIRRLLPVLHCSILAWRIPWRSLVGYRMTPTAWGQTVGRNLATNHQQQRYRNPEFGEGWREGARHNIYMLESFR